MKFFATRAGFSRDIIKDRERRQDDRADSKLPVVIVFAATIGIFPLAYALDASLGIGWLGSAFGALSLAAIFAASACMLVRR